MTWARWAAEELDAIRSAGRWRSTRAFDCLGPHGELAGIGTVRSFASNDYLGLSAHPAVIAAAREALQRFGTGSGASRLVVGTRSLHEELEAELAAWKATEAAIVFPTGYAANLSVLGTFGGPGVDVFSDELNHASIIDGCRLGRSRVSVYRHRDVRHLRQLLDATARAVVVSDSVFSMDGDLADLDALAECCAEVGALLVLDEAHAVLGPALPSAAVETLAAETLAAGTLAVGTLSKTLGSLGGFVAGPRVFVDLLRNRARPYIFSTAPTPADTAAALAALRVLRSVEGDELRARLRANIDSLRPGHPSPIMPIILGSEERALAASARLLERGLLVPAIRPPTVPAGTSRLRVTVSAAHRPEDLAALRAALDELDGLDTIRSAAISAP